MAGRTAARRAAIVLVALLVGIPAMVGGAPPASARAATASVDAPVVSSLAPTVGSSLGGNQVFLNGSGFTGARAVRFGTTNAAFFAVWGDTLIVALAPAHAEGATEVTVTTAAGTNVTGPSSTFTYQPAANGGIRGQVSTEDHGSAAGMVALAIDPTTLAMVAIALVGADGSFAFTTLAPGPYLVAILGNATYKTKLAGFEFDPTAAAIGPATTMVVTSGSTTVLDPIALWRVTPKPSKRFDFTGDGRADVVWEDGYNGDWFMATAVPPTGATKIWTNLGIPVAGDYDGDGLWEPASVDLAAGTWVTNGPAGTITHPQPATTNRPPSTAHDGPEAVPGAYDGNRTTLPAWYRQEDATWFIRGHAPIQFGSGPSAPTGTSQVGRDDYDRPVPADYDGDGRTDLAVWNPRSNTWKYRRSTDGVVVTRVFGANYALPAVGDFNADGKADLAVYSSSGWQIDGVPPLVFGDSLLPGTNYLTPAVADYDGDGKADRGFWNSSQTAQATVSFLRSSDLGTGGWVLTTATTNKTPIPVEGSFARVVDLASLTLIWRCVSNAIYC